MKRFYSSVTLQNDKTENGQEAFQVFLDERPLKTPQKRPVFLPSLALAKAIQAEWAAVKEDIKADLMPCFSMAVTVIDRVSPNRKALMDELVRYAGNDVICYRANQEDQPLLERQTNTWDRWLEWASHQHSLALHKTHGLMPVTQSEQSLAIAHDLMAGLTDWQLGCVYRAVTLCGSFILGLAFFQHEIDAEQLFTIAFLEELYQNELWGLDAEAVERQNAIRAELSEIEKFLAFL